MTIMLKANSIQVEASDDVLLPGIAIDKKLTFKQHVQNLCRKAQYELHALRRMRKFLTTEKAKILDTVFLDSQFNYALLLWTFCRKTFYLKIEKIHHNTLRVVYESNDTYDNLLLQSNKVSVKQRHLRFLMTEIYKSKDVSIIFCFCFDDSIIYLLVPTLMPPFISMIILRPMYDMFHCHILGNFLVCYSYLWLWYGGGSLWYPVLVVGCIFANYYFLLFVPAYLYIKRPSVSYFNTCFSYP